MEHLVFIGCVQPWILHSLLNDSKFNRLDPLRPLAAVAVPRRSPGRSLLPWLASQNRAGIGPVSKGTPTSTKWLGLNHPNLCETQAPKCGFKTKELNDFGLVGIYSINQETLVGCTQYFFETVEATEWPTWPKDTAKHNDQEIWLWLKLSTPKMDGFPTDHFCGSLVP